MTTACLRPTGESHATSAGARAWRPWPGEPADLLCVDEAGGDVEPRIHNRFAVTVLPAPAVIRVESGRSVATDRNWVLLVPPSQLHAARIEEPAAGALTLLLAESRLRGLPMPEQSALVPEAVMGAEVRALVAQWRRSLRPLNAMLAARQLVERLLARGTPLGVASARRATLLPIRDYLHSHLARPIPSVALAAMSGLTECHLIRAFHMEFGLPPHAYHLRVRLAAAADLLATALAVSTATYECGFADQSHLSRKFKDVYGLTPTAWASATAGVERLRARAPAGFSMPAPFIRAAWATGEERSRRWAPANCR